MLFRSGVKADSAKAGKTSSSNVETGEASNLAGSESAPHVEPQGAAPEAEVIVTPPSSTPTAPSTGEAQAKEIRSESAAAPNSENTNTAAPDADTANAATT